MSISTYNLPDQSGASYLASVNLALQSLAGQNSNATAPTETYAYMWWYDTTLGLLKMRNAANNAWVIFGPIADSTKLDLYAANTLRQTIDSSGNINFTSTAALKLPVGTTAQRPTVAQGQIRYNTTLAQFEGYNGTVWGAIGGGGNWVPDTFSGNGSTTAYTLSVDPGSINNTMVYISGVYQQKSTYSVSGTTLTFTTAPPTGTNNIQVMSGLALSIGTPAAGTVTGASLSAGNMTSAQLQAALSDEVGTGAAVFYTAAQQIKPITASVAANALTVTLNPTVLDFRSATLASGAINTRTVAAAISVVVPNTATLGTVNAIQSRIAVLAIDNAGTVELAVVNISGGINLNEEGVISTTAISAAATSASVIYSTTARTNVPYRVVGFVDSTQATAGTWATAPSQITGAGGNVADAMSSLGYGQTWQSVARTAGTTYYNTTGKPIQVNALATGGSTASVAIFTSAVVSNSTVAATSAIAFATAIIPPNTSYIITNVTGTLSVFELR